MRPTRIATARQLRSVRQRTGFMRIVDVGIRSPSAPDGRCKVRVAAGAVKRPRFRSNLSTFMSNCILVVTTLESNGSGRCRTTDPPTGARFAPCGYLPAWGLFSSQFMQTRAGMFAAWLTQMSFFKYNSTVVKVAFLPVVECIRLKLNLI
jgi:hypothetical protein